ELRAGLERLGQTFPLAPDRTEPFIPPAPLTQPQPTLIDTEEDQHWLERASALIGGATAEVSGAMRMLEELISLTLEHFSGLEQRIGELQQLRSALEVDPNRQDRQGVVKAGGAVAKNRVCSTHWLEDIEPTSSANLARVHAVRREPSRIEDIIEGGTTDSLDSTKLINSCARTSTHDSGRERNLYALGRSAVVGKIKPAPTFDCVVTAAASEMFEGFEDATLQDVSAIGTHHAIDPRKHHGCLLDCTPRMNGVRHSASAHIKPDTLICWTSECCKLKAELGIVVTDQGILASGHRNAGAAISTFALIQVEQVESIALR
ncbi:MAG: hypothetical protein EBU81_13770, partial [Proteobacteria bacterium]|nr:hypothetical protein [Pseudomonadota bacterium]